MLLKLFLKLFAQVILVQFLLFDRQQLVSCYLRNLKYKHRCKALSRNVRNLLDFLFYERNFNLAIREVKTLMNMTLSLSQSVILSVSYCVGWVSLSTAFLTIDLFLIFINFLDNVMKLQVLNTILEADFLEKF